MTLELAAHKGTFAVPAEAPPGTIPLAFRPQAVIAWWSRQDGHGVERGNRGGIGFWAPEGSVAVAWRSEDAATSARVEQIDDDAALLGLGASGRTPEMRADVAVGPDGVRVSWTHPPAETWLVHFLALGGLTAARAGRTAAGEAAASVPVVPGGPHDLVLLVPAAPAGGDLTIGLGAIAAGGRAAAGYTVPDNGPPGAVVGSQRRGVAAVGPPAPRFAYLALTGVRAKVGADGSTAGPGRKRTRVGFRPEGLLLFSWGLGASKSPKGIGRLCLGAASGEASGCTSWDDRNVNAPETCTHVASSDERALLVTDTQTGGLHAEASLAGVDERGFTLDWRRSDRGRREFLYVALGAGGRR